MKILSSILNTFTDEIINSSSNYQSSKKNLQTEENILGIIDEKKQNTNSNKLLSKTEKSTLHVFFGSEKPEEMTMYGDNKLTQIYKGHLLDLKG